MRALTTGALALVSVLMGCPSESDAGPEAEPATLVEEIEAMSAWTDADELTRIAERALAEGRPSDIGDTVARLGEIAREMRTAEYQRRLSAEAEEALRAEGSEATGGRIEQTMSHNRRLRQEGVVAALGVLAPHRIDAVGQLLWIAEQRWDAEVCQAALDAVEGHLPASQSARVAALGANRNVPLPVRLAALRRVTETGSDRALSRLWPILESATPAELRSAAAEAAVASGGAEDLHEHLPEDREYPPDMVDAIVERLAAAEPDAETIDTLLRAPSWPARAIALRYLAHVAAPDAAQRASALTGDRAALMPVELWTADDGPSTVGDLARQVADQRP